MENPEFMNGDILFDVLSRLPTKTLLRMKCVCKRWYKLISDCSFVKAQLQKTELDLAGFIFQEKYQFCVEDIKSFSYIPVNFGSEVQNMTFGFLPEEVVVLASCNGLVCCRNCFPTEHPTIYVCNPLNKQWMNFEVAGLDRHSNIVLAFDPSRDPINVTISFKIVQVQKHTSEQEEQYYTFEIYSSKTGAWRRSNEICYFEGSLSKNRGIYAKGILHWLGNIDEILVFDVEKELSLLISTPIPTMDFFANVPETCIGESKDLLHFIMASEDGINVWYLEDYFEAKWILKHSKPLQVIEEENPKMFCNLYKIMKQKLTIGMDSWMDPLAFKDDILLLRVSADIYFYHINSGKMSKICSLANLGPNAFNPTVLSYSMSLVPLEEKPQ